MCVFARLCCSLYLSFSTYSIVLACLHVFSVWLCKAEESRELSKVVALVSSASGLCGRYNQPDCTRGGKKKSLKAPEELKFATKIQEVCLRFNTVPLFNRTRYTQLHQLWKGAVDARISPWCSQPRDSLFAALLPYLSQSSDALCISCTQPPWASVNELVKPEQLRF